MVCLFVCLAYGHVHDGMFVCGMVVWVMVCLFVWRMVVCFWLYSWYMLLLLLLFHICCCCCCCCRRRRVVVVKRSVFVVHTHIPSP